MALSPEQVEAYLDRIALPQAARKTLRGGNEGKDALQAITTLQQYHMAAVPFENLDLHYSSHHSLPQETEIVYEHIVVRRRGGTCFQVHQLFAQLLRSLGFQVYCTGGHLNAPASLGADPNLDKSKVVYGPWVHVNTIVTIGAQAYVVDTAGGPFNSTSPVPLVHDKPVIDVWPRCRRMIYSSIPGWDPHQKWWRMQFRDDEKEPWMDVYCFMETEWRPVDFHIMVAGLASLGAGWFKSRVVCFRIILEEDTPVGYLMIWEDELRRVYKGELQVVRQFFNELDRVTTLADEFGVMLSEDEQKQIVGTRTELKDDSVASVSPPTRPSATALIGCKRSAHVTPQPPDSNPDHTNSTASQNVGDRPKPELTHPTSGKTSADPPQINSDLPTFNLVSTTRREQLNSTCPHQIPLLRPKRGPDGFSRTSLQEQALLEHASYSSYVRRPRINLWKLSHISAIRLLQHAIPLPARARYECRGPLREELAGDHEFDFFDGEFETAPADGVGDIFAGPYYSWLRDPESVTKASLSQSIENIKEYVAENGPYDGAMGFSQGAAMVMALLYDHQAKQPFSPPPFQVAIFLCGGMPEPLRQLCPDGLKLPVATTHILGGKKDYLYGETLQLRDACSTAFRAEFEHNKGHSIPRKPELTASMAKAITQSIDHMRFTT
ncbi:hypothetical protein V499_00042 [Pseudogymnoascus sp. VKM F-103]|nr:hypothetical protein V499_00042 [Pseudogymnoascus sp. VKM F-103]